MVTIEQLIKQARHRRDETISQARQHYRATVRDIKKASRKNRLIVTKGKKRRPRYNSKLHHDGQFSTMSTRAAAEVLLIELGPLTQTELVVELQRRGHRPGHDPRLVANAIRVGLEYHAGRYYRDDAGRWSAKPQ